MGHRIQNIGIYLVVFLLTACGEKNSCFESGGIIKSKIVKLDDFDRVFVFDNIDIIIHPDTTNFAIITTNENLIDGIDLNIQTDTLLITNNNHCAWTKGYDYSIQADVFCDSIHWFYYNGSGDIIFTDTLKVLEFVFESKKSAGEVLLLLDVNYHTLYNFRGTQDIFYYGQCKKRFKIRNEANGIINSLNMPAKKIDVQHSGTNDLYVFVLNELISIVSYVGNIYYTGNPTIIDNTETHSGKLIKYTP